MKSVTIVFSILLASIMGLSQTNESDFARSMVGKKMDYLTSALDSTTVFYKIHYPQNIKPQQKVLSISMDNKEVKVYTFYFTKYDRLIDKIIINYRHDNINHLRDLEKLKDINYHVGKYSTDIIYK